MHNNGYGLEYGDDGLLWVNGKQMDSNLDNNKLATMITHYHQVGDTTIIHMVHRLYTILKTIEIQTMERNISIMDID